MWVKKFVDSKNAVAVKMILVFLWLIECVGSTWQLENGSLESPVNARTIN